MSLPIFEDVPAGETRQVNGPVYGLRVLAAPAGSAAALAINGVPVPVQRAVLLTIPAEPGEPWDRVRMTGPILVQLAMSERTNIGTALSAGAEGLTDAQMRAAPVPVSGPLTDAQLRAAAVVVRRAPPAVVYNSGIVLAGAEIAPAAFDVGAFSHLSVYVSNIGGGADRDLRAQLFADDGVTPIGLSILVSTISGAGQRYVTIGHSASPTPGSTPPVDALTIALPRFVQIKLVAGAVATGQIVVWGHP